MTEKAHPSNNRTAESFKTAVGFAHAGGLEEGYIVDGAEPTEVSEQDSAIDETQLNAFAESHSADSYDVTIDPGEAFVWGAWVAKDTPTNVTVAASTADQTIYVGWNRNSPDDVIIGLASAFDAGTEDEDMKIPLFDVDTDGSGVTSVTDRRDIGRSIQLEDATAERRLTIPSYATENDLPDQPEASVAYVEDEQQLYVFKGA